MLPVQLLFLRPQAVIEVRIGCKSGGQGYPLHVPKDVTKLLQIDMVNIVTFLLIARILITQNSVKGSSISCRRNASSKD